MDRVAGGRRRRRNRRAAAGGVRIPLGAGFAALVFAASAAGPVGAAEYLFRVLRDGDPIGKHRVAVRREGCDGRTEVEVETDLDVRFGFLPVFSFEHERREVWEDGRPVSIKARTDDNGTVYDISVRPNGDGLVRVVNGRAEAFGDDVQILTLWNRDVLRHESFVSVVEDKTLRVSFERVGREMLRVDGRRVAAERYRMTGDEEQDIWYDAQGRVVKVAMSRRGSDIEFVLDRSHGPEPVRC